MHLLGSGNVPGIVERAGVAEIEAAFLVRKRRDIGAGYCGETEQGDHRGGEDACGLVSEPEPTEDGEGEDADEAEQEGKGLGEVSASEREAHQSRVAEPVGGEMVEQRGHGEEQERLQKRVGADLAEGEFALRRDDEQGQAEVAQGGAVQYVDDSLTR